MSIARVPRTASGLILGLLLGTAHPALAGDHPFQLDLDDDEDAFMFAVFGTAGYGAIAQSDTKEEVFLLGGGAMLRLYTPDINILGNLWGMEYRYSYMVDLNGSTSVFSGQFSWGVVF
jgi:hypothetical protein